ncbi:unnamed protein product [Caenorhabditis sp. 36 PRJEB53466]|nr:unnamed protein product [Caenorhabditis sp. 36 PRJEB53466]
MLKQIQENDQLKLENVRLQSELARLKIELDIVREGREKSETQTSILYVENRELRARIAELEAPSKETPILDKKKVHYEDEIDEISEIKALLKQAQVQHKKDEDDVEYSEISVRNEHSEYCSTWNKDISILDSHDNYITLKNNHYDKPRCIDDFLFVRVVDGVDTVPPTPVPLGIIIPPGEEYTIHANHAGGREIAGKSCIFHRIKTFGRGKVTEDRILDANGRITAKFMFYGFK